MRVFASKLGLTAAEAEQFRNVLLAAAQSAAKARLGKALTAGEAPAAPYSSSNSSFKASLNPGTTSPPSSTSPTSSTRGARAGSCTRMV